MFPLHMLIAVTGLAVASLAAVYALLALLAALLWRARRSPPHPAVLPPVTLLKPLCGAEPGLYEHLRSFCRQDYPALHIVFGARDPADPALLVARRLAAEFPELPIDVVASPQLHGGNHKISNLINMAEHARHAVLVMADSDTWVGPDYLRTVTAPLLDRGVGLVTCIYRGVPTAGIWSRLGAMYVNDWFVPSVLLSLMFGHGGYATGQTLCLRRETLEAVGGLQAIADHLADDYRLGELVRQRGLRIAISPYPVHAQHDEPDLKSLVRHELRWMRTTRVLRPLSSCFMFFSFSVPLATLGALLALAQPGLSTAAWVVALAAALARLALHFVRRAHPAATPWSDLWLLPGRDLLTCWVWCQSFFSHRVSWRGSEFDVGIDGVMRRPS